MNNGKFKKATIIFMLIAVAIITCSILWVVIFKGDTSYEKTNREFFEQTSATKYAAAVQNEDITVDGDELIDVEIKIPISFILEDINANSQLTKEQKDAGFKSAVSDGNSSVTYTISKADYKVFLRNYRFEIVTEIEKSLSSYSYLKDVNCNDDLSNIIVKVDRAGFKSSDGDAISTAVSLPSMVYQMYAQLGMNCNITIADAETSAVIATYNP
ncbi:MAG: hypothetical protein II356_06165 [Clostridia bacterium]|nr:hypothetical protein [Clostridia bacterium]MBR0348443.1 hypothetical protein [Clostridia bacterium]